MISLNDSNNNDDNDYNNNDNFIDEDFDISNRSSSSSSIRLSALGGHSSAMQQRYNKVKEWIVDTSDAIMTRIVSDRTNLVFYGGIGILCIMILAIFATDKEQVEELGQEILGFENGNNEMPAMDTSSHGPKHIIMGTTVEGKPIPETLLQPVPHNVNIVIIGDSISRYMYLSLIYFLRWGRWFEPTLEKSNLVCERSFHSPFHDNELAEFYFQTGRMVQPYELCDCYKSKMDTRNLQHIENRYYHDPTMNNTVTFFHAYGHEMAIHGRIQAHDAYNLSKWDWHKKENGLLQHEYKEPAWEFESYDDMVDQYIANMVPKPDHVIINAGQWFNRFGPVGKNEEVSQDFADALERLDLKTATWRTTTHKKGGELLSRHQKETDDFMCTLLGNCLNVSWTEHVVDFLFWDRLHFYEPVYRAMNEALLESLGYLPRGYQKLKKTKLIKGYVNESMNEYAFHMDGVDDEDD